MKNLLFTLMLLFSTATSATSTYGEPFFPIYIAQTDNYSCGPVALYNALQYKGIVATLEDISYLMETKKPESDTEEKPTGGTKLTNFKKAVLAYGIEFKEIDKKEIKPFGTYLVRMVTPYKGSYKDTWGHMVFMANGKVYNIRRGEIETDVDWLVIQAMMYEEYDNHPIILEIL